MSVDVAAFLLYLKSAGLVSLLGVGAEYWLDQRLARSLAKDINTKYKKYKGKTMNNYTCSKYC